MIYIFTALYSEAHCLIKQFHLTKITESTRFQQFKNESGQILLTVTGAGEIAAACAVGGACTKYPPGKQDFLLNIGICACAKKQTGVFLIYKLVELASGKTFYPDMIYRHEFQEAELATGMVPWKHPKNSSAGDSGKLLYDMEAAAVYQAGACFFAPHQMVFLKVISDSGESARLSDGYVRDVMELHREKICTYISQLMQIRDMEKQTIPDFLNESEDGLWFRRLCADLHCSKAMRDALYKHLYYAALAGIDYKSAVRKMYAENKLPCRDKREGKQCFEQLKLQLL